MIYICEHIIPLISSKCKAVEKIPARFQLERAVTLSVIWIVFKLNHSLFFSRCVTTLITAAKEIVTQTVTVFEFVFADGNIREFKQLTTAGATTAAVTEKVWGEYVSVLCQIFLVETYRKFWIRIYKLMRGNFDTIFDLN